MSTYYVRGQGSVQLSKADFVGSGGEGSIYAKGDTAYKLYTDPTRMIPEGKIRELAGILDINIIKPERVVADQSGHPVGYTMRFVSPTHPLCRLFTLGFKRKTGLTQEGVLRLIQKMQKSIGHVHRTGTLIVDRRTGGFLPDLHGHTWSAGSHVPARQEPDADFQGSEGHGA